MLHGTGTAPGGENSKSEVDWLAEVYDENLGEIDEWPIDERRAEARFILESIQRSIERAVYEARPPPP